MNKLKIWQRTLDVGMFLATIAAVAASWFDEAPDWALLLILILFVIMFFFRWQIDEDSRQWMRSNWFDLVLVVLLSSPILRMLMALRLVHLLPALRLGALLRANRHRLIQLMVISGESLPASLALMFALVFCFGTATYLFESGVPDAQVTNLQDGLWWAFVTLTTVGYGDIVPITAGGRIVAVVAMIFGIVVYSLIVANLTIFLQQYGERHATRNRRAGDRKDDNEVKDGDQTTSVASAAQANQQEQRPAPEPKA